jgi:hypothetical protein
LTDQRPVGNKTKQRDGFACQCRYSMRSSVTQSYRGWAFGGWHVAHRGSSRSNRRRQRSRQHELVPDQLRADQAAEQDQQWPGYEATTPARPQPRQVEKTQEPQSHHIADNWFAWRLEVGAIILPGFISTIIKFCLTNKLEWAPVAADLSHGIFIIPVMILAGDAFRRWIKVPKRGRMRLLLRLLGLGFSGIATLACLLAATVAGVANMSPATGHALANISVWCLVAALPTSFVGVIVSNREVISNEGQPNSELPG